LLPTIYDFNSDYISLLESPRRGIKNVLLWAGNPGDYEFKLLWNNRLARSIKFTIAPGGKFDNGIATANKLGSDRVIVPIQIIGDQDGQWDRGAWKKLKLSTETH
jgi:hypothetical protein